MSTCPSIHYLTRFISSSLARMSTCQQRIKLSHSQNNKDRLAGSHNGRHGAEVSTAARSHIWCVCLHHIVLNASIWLEFSIFLLQACIYTGCALCLESVHSLYTLNNGTATKMLLAFCLHLSNCITNHLQNNQLLLTGQIKAPFLLLQLRQGMSLQPSENLCYKQTS